jgi:hypothetical protein
MRIIRFIAVFAAIMSCSPALAQSSPNWTYGQVPTPAQWNYAFAMKQDALNYVPLNVAGDTMLGKLYAAPSASGSAGLNLGVGTAPISPNNGDIWVTNSSIFVRINGVTVSPFILPSPCSGPMVGTSGSITCYSSGLPAAYLASGAAATSLGFTPLNPANNLSDVSTVAAARSNLGLGTAATKASSAGGATVASVTGAITAGHIATFADTAGTVQDGGSNGGGTVTSVAVTVPSILTTSGCTITTSGTCALGLATQTANTALRGPASGSAAAPTFRAAVCADMPAGVPCLLNTLTASNSSALQDTTSITATYTHYKLVFMNIVRATAAANCEIQVYASSYQTSGYLAGAYKYNASSTGSRNNATTYIPCDVNDSTSSDQATGLIGGISGEIYFDAPAAGYAKWRGLISSYSTSPAEEGALIFGFWNSASAFTGYQVIFSSGNIVSGTVELSGWN